MKFWKAFPPLALLLFLTPAVHAQIPGYGGYSFWEPYYPGAIYSPYYPQAYYPQPYGTQGYYVGTYGLDPYMEARNTESIDSLTRQVQQLNDEIRMLESELTSAQAVQAQQAQQAEVQARAVDEPPPSPGPPVILVLKNGQHIESQGYAAMGDTLWILTPSGSRRISRSSVDVAATKRENLKRGLDFPDLGS